MDVWLSGAVVAALIAGVFAVINSLINSRRLTKLERQRAQFKLEGERLAWVRSAYERFCDVKSLGNMVNNSDFRKGDDWSAFRVEFENAVKEYINLIKTVKPGLDDDLYRKWLVVVEEHDKAVDTYNRALKEQEDNARALLILDVGYLVRAICNMEETCDKVLTEQIRRLSGGSVTSSK